MEHLVEHSGICTHRPWVAECNHEIVACALLLELSTDDPGVFYAEIQVLPYHRCLGIGGVLLERILEFVTGLNGKTLLGEVLDDDDAGV